MCPRLKNRNSLVNSLHRLNEALRTLSIEIEAIGEVMSPLIESSHVIRSTHGNRLRVVALRPKEFKALYIQNEGSIAHGDSRIAYLGPAVILGHVVGVHSLRTA